jgi:ATP-dependent DNA helicase DinG
MLAEQFKDALDAAEVGRVQDQDSGLVRTLNLIAAGFRKGVSGMEGGADKSPEKTQAQSGLSEIFDIASRMAKLDDDDVVWISEREQFGRQLNVAPLEVAGLMREKVFGDAVGILTSATLSVGGKFDSTAYQVGFNASEKIDDSVGAGEAVAADEDDALNIPGKYAWRGIDVGSPFDYAKQGICYLAKDLPNPSRDGLSPELLAEVAELIWAAGGRTLGLFASQRSAEQAAAYVRKELPKLKLLCQGEAQLPELTRQFCDDPATSLFGTLSLWQGIDAPGATCQLVIIDKIPFPRPDDPLMQARKQAVDDAGGNGFMQVAAAHAGLLLAQGSGRLIRHHDDRGLVAILDPRIVKARYGSFLRACLPDFWTTTDREVAVEALRRLNTG